MEWVFYTAKESEYGSRSTIVRKKVYVEMIYLYDKQLMEENNILFPACLNQWE